MTFRGQLIAICSVQSQFRITLNAFRLKLNALHQAGYDLPPAKCVLLRADAKLHLQNSFCCAQLLFSRWQFAGCKQLSLPGNSCPSRMLLHRWRRFRSLNLCRLRGADTPLDIHLPILSPAPVQLMPNIQVMSAKRPGHLSCWRATGAPGIVREKN